MTESNASEGQEQPTVENDDDSVLVEYRKHLVEVSVRSQESLDRGLLTLSGGALGVSIVFLKDIVGEQAAEVLWVLLLAWICWTATIVAVLATFWWARRASETAIARCDDGTIWDHAHAPGGVFSSLTRKFNAVAGITFFVGIVAMLVFVGLNLSERNTRYEQRSGKVESPAADPDAKAAKPSPSRGPERID